MSSIQYVALGQEAFRCTIVATARDSTRHIELVVMDVAHDSAPLLDGDDGFLANEALVGNLLKFGVSEYAYRHTDDTEQRKAFRRAATRASRAALQLADLADLGWYQMRRGWCSRRTCAAQGRSRSWSRWA